MYLGSNIYIWHTSSDCRINSRIMFSYNVYLSMKNQREGFLRLVTSPSDLEATFIILSFPKTGPHKSRQVILARERAPIVSRSCNLQEDGALDNSFRYAVPFRLVADLWPYCSTLLLRFVFFRQANIDRPNFDLRANWFRAVEIFCIR